MISFDYEDYRNAMNSSEDSDEFLRMHRLIEKEEKILRKALLQKKTIRLKDLKGRIYEASKFNRKEDAVLLKLINPKIDDDFYFYPIWNLVMEKFQMIDEE